MNTEARIDKWLWAARIFKTRSIAADACKNGRVSVNGVSVKPSRTVKADDVVSVRKPPITYSFRLLKPIEQRVGAKLLPEIYENVTPQDITAEAIAARAAKAGVHCFVAPGTANICSAEGVVLVQALKDGALEIDFGSPGTVYDALNGEFVCNGPKATLPFRMGETRLFRTSARR